VDSVSPHPKKLKEKRNEKEGKAQRAEEIKN
jgi:hypothetical protein